MEDKEKVEQPPINGAELNDAEEETLTIEEIINIEKQLENDAEILLGGQNDMVCTYPEGYKFRQPLYSCKTCFEKTGQRAGICYACSVNCHADHDLIELYTKRKFSCDCGNSKFEGKCKLFEEKSPTNPLNKYNDNFQCLYCVCKKPYPPLNESVSDEEEMYQCMICEDWYHFSHIFDDTEKNIEDQGEGITQELICNGCVSKLHFLMVYSSLLSRSTVVDNNNTDLSITCKLEHYKQTQEIPAPRSLLLNSNWREMLCKCKNCMALYEDNDCTFLLEHEDTFDYYDQQRQSNMALTGELPSTSSNDENISVYNLVAKETNNRDVALNVYLGVEAMKRHVTDMMIKCGENGKAVTKEDVQKCFEELQAKRPRLDL